MIPNLSTHLTHTEAHIQVEEEAGSQGSHVIKWAWENVGAQGFYFGPDIETEDQSLSDNREEPGLSHGKGSGPHSLQQQQPSTSRGKGKRKAVWSLLGMHDISIWRYYRDNCL